MNSEALDEKLKKMKGVASSIALHGSKILTKEQSAKIDELQDRMEFRLKQLTMRCKEDEADIKLEIMQNILDILNNKVHA